MTPVTRREMLRALAALGSLAGSLVALGCAGPAAARSAVSPSASDSGGMMAGGGMMGAATTADMSSYMDMFDQHTKIRRTVELIPGGVRTTAESDDPALAGRIRSHVRSMYQHLSQSQEVTCMSPTLPTLFRNASGYKRQLTITSKGVQVTETSDDPQLAQMIQGHANEVTGFVQDGMPAMMRSTMRGG